MNRRGFLEQLPCFSHEIKGNVGNLSVLAVASAGKTQRVLWMLLRDILFERGSGFILAALDFHGNNFHPALQEKIYFAIFDGIIAWLDSKLSAKLLQNIVFGKRPFELIVRFQKYRTVIDSRHVFEKPGVKEKELKLLRFIEGRKRMLSLRNIAYAV